MNNVEKLKKITEMVYHLNEKDIQDIKLEQSGTQIRMIVFDKETRKIIKFCCARFDGVVFENRSLLTEYMTLDGMIQLLEEMGKDE